MNIHTTACYAPGIVIHNPTRQAARLYRCPQPWLDRGRVRSLFTGHALLQLHANDAALPAHASTIKYIHWIMETSVHAPCQLQKARGETAGRSPDVRCMRWSPSPALAAREAMIPCVNRSQTRKSRYGDGHVASVDGLQLTSEDFFCVLALGRRLFSICRHWAVDWALANVLKLLAGESSLWLLATPPLTVP